MAQLFADDSEPDAATVSLWVFHPDYRRTAGALHPSRLKEMAGRYGQVSCAKLFTNRIGTAADRRQWMNHGFSILLSKRRDANWEKLKEEMAVEALKEAIGSKPGAVVLFVGDQSPALASLENYLDKQGIRTYSFSANDPVLESGDTAIRSSEEDEPPQSGPVVKKERDPLDELQSRYPRTYEWVYELLRVSTSTENDVSDEVAAFLKTEILEAENIPDFFFALVLILASRLPAPEARPNIPMRSIRNLLERHMGFSPGAKQYALDILKTEGSVVPWEDEFPGYKYNRPTDDPVFELARRVWRICTVKRAELITNRVLASLEILTFNKEGLDEESHRDLERFLAIQKMSEVRRKRAYAKWGLIREERVAEFEARIARIADEANLIDATVDS